MRELHPEQRVMVWGRRQGISAAQHTKQPPLTLCERNSQHAEESQKQQNRGATLHRWRLVMELDRSSWGACSPKAGSAPDVTATCALAASADACAGGYSRIGVQRWLRLTGSCNTVMYTEPEQRVNSYS
jgi:hypothetical protein